MRRECGGDDPDLNGNPEARNKNRLSTEGILDFAAIRGMNVAIVERMVGNMINVTDKRTVAATTSFQRFQAVNSHAISKVDVQWCDVRGTALVQLFRGDVAVTYFLCEQIVSVDWVKETLVKVLFGDPSLASARIFVNGKPTEAGSLASAEALTRIVNAMLRRRRH